MNNSNVLRPGSRVIVPWGVDESRHGVVLEIWGEPSAPTHVRVRLDSVDPEDDELAVLLLSPSVVTPAA